MTTTTTTPANTTPRTGGPDASAPPPARHSSRRGSRHARMPRGSRPATALLVALLATAACAFGAVEAISLAVNQRCLGFDVHAVTRYARTTHWTAIAVTITGASAAVLGLLVLLAGLLPSRRRVVELDTGDPHLAVGIPAASLRRTLHSRITTIDGISRVRIRGRRRLTITATGLRDTSGLTEAIQTAATDQLDAAAPIHRPRLRVRLRRKDS